MVMSLIGFVLFPLRGSDSYLGFNFYERNVGFFLN
jgi:hypothetical protein